VVGMSVGSILVGRWLRLVLMSGPWGGLRGDLLVGVLWEELLMGDSLMGR
jgi:hypothetical protein